LRSLDFIISFDFIVSLDLRYSLFAHAMPALVVPGYFFFGVHMAVAKYHGSTKPAKKIWYPFEEMVRKMIIIKY
jgi:hypothetical protein